MKNSKLKLGVLSAALLTAVVATPTLGSAAGLANAPFHLKATNLEQSGTYAIKPGIKKAGEAASPGATPTSAPGSGSTPAPTGGATSSPAPSTSPTPSYPKPTVETAFRWTLASDGGAQLDSVISLPTSDIVIPRAATVGGKILPVTSIKGFAFDSRKITSVVLPDTLVSIGSHAFNNNLLTSVSLPDSVVSAELLAFGNNRISSVTFSKSMKILDSAVFSYNYLTTLEIPDTVTVVRDRAFSNNKLTAVKIPSSVASIGDSAFMYNSIKSLGLSTGLKTIANDAFYGNGAIEALTIPSTVTYIGTTAFTITNLKAVYMEGNAPTTFSTNSITPATGKTIYYKAGATGYSNPWKGYTTATY